MGIYQKFVPFLDQLLEDLGKEFNETENIRMIELGNQNIHPPMPKTGNISKLHFNQQQGVEHISLDWNGREGAQKKDLGKLIDDIAPTHLITNFGTSEHVYNHYNCFKNIHNLCLPGGYIFHYVPAIASWPGHGLRWYGEKFFIDLVDAVEYEIIELHSTTEEPYTPELGTQMIWCLMKKSTNSPFCDEKQFSSIEKSLHTLNK
jgi:hypothetical protein